MFTYVIILKKSERHLTRSSKEVHKIVCTKNTVKFVFKIANVLVPVINDTIKNTINNEEAIKKNFP